MTEEHERLVGIPSVEGGAAKAMEGGGLAQPVADLAGMLQGFVEERGRSYQVPLPLCGQPERDEVVGDPLVVFHLAVAGQRFLDQRAGSPVVAAEGCRVGEIADRRDERMLVTQVAERRRCLGQQLLGPVVLSLVQRGQAEVAQRNGDAAPVSVLATSARASP